MEGEVSVRANNRDAAAKDQREAPRLKPKGPPVPSPVKQAELGNNKY